MNGTTPQYRTAKSSTFSPLSAIVEKKLLGYAAAASAAGVAMLAFSVPTEAEVIATKVNISVPINAGLIQFDINNDGQMDFGLSAFAGSTTCTTGGRARRELGCPFDDQTRVKPVKAGNEVGRHGSSYGAKCAAALPGGVKVGSSHSFVTNTLVMAGHAGTSRGVYFCPWVHNSQNQRYLGVKFTDSSNQVHYGWVRVKVKNVLSVQITAYAYETVPNQPITTGATQGAMASQSSDGTNAEPASLGRLAQGGAGLTAWRRRESE